MEPLSFRKIGKLRSEMRLAASWGPKIAQIGSLARWKMLYPLRSPPMSRQGARSGKIFHLASEAGYREKELLPADNI